MIKAEVISHEGNPGPNWLDQCRTTITPGRTTAFVLALATATLLAFVLNGRSTPPVTVNQQPSPSTGNLTVEPVRDPTATAGTTTLNLQSPGNPSQLSDDANALGAGKTPSLNNAKTPAASTKQSPTPSAGQSQWNGKALTNTVQTTVQDVNQVVKDTPKQVTEALGGLGL